MMDIHGLLMAAGLSLLVSGGCENAGEKVEYIGETTLTTEKILSGELYITYGYSFEKGDLIPYPSSGRQVPDIVPVNKTDVNNSIIGAILGSPDNPEAFHLTGSFNSSEAAESFFRSYDRVTDSVFTPLARDVLQNQVWTMQTINGRFAKLIVRDVVIRTDNPVSDDYIEIRIGFHYQPDGSRIFVE